MSLYTAPEVVTLIFNIIFVDREEVFIILLKLFFCLPFGPRQTNNNYTSPRSKGDTGLGYRS